MDRHFIFLSLTIPLIAILLYLPLTTKFENSNSLGKYIWLFNNCIILYLLTILSLSFAASEKYKNQKDISSGLKDEADKTHSKPPKLSNHSAFRKWILTTRLLGLLSGLYILTLPIFYPATNPLLDCLLRVTTFFYGCKLLDLSVSRASSPPKFLAGDDSLDSWPDRVAYICLLTSQTRYCAFEGIAVKQTRIGSAQEGNRWFEYIPLLIIPLTIFFPHIAEFKVLSGLVVIQFGLEALHWICHGNECDSGKLFHRPFASKTLSEFWGVRWHQGAQSFLMNLGYAPAKLVTTRLFGNKEVGRAAGVLAAFGLSGIWHGWCAMSLVKEEEAWSVGVGLWAVFVLQGVGCLVEKVTWGKRQGGWVQRVCVWVYAIEVGAVWFRMAEEKRVEIPWVERLIKG